MTLPPARCVYFQPLIPLDPQTQLQGWSDSTTNRALAEATRVQTLVPCLQWPLSTETRVTVDYSQEWLPSIIAKNRVRSRYLSAKKEPPCYQMKVLTCVLPYPPASHSAPSNLSFPLLMEWNPPISFSGGSQKVRHSGIQTNILFIELHMNFH